MRDKANHFLRELALSLRGRSIPYLSWSEKNHWHVPNVLMYYDLLGVDSVTKTVNWFDLI